MHVVIHCIGAVIGQVGDGKRSDVNDFAIGQGEQCSIGLNCCVPNFCSTRIGVHAVRPNNTHEGAAHSACVFIIFEHRGRESPRVGDVRTGFYLHNYLRQSGCDWSPVGSKWWAPFKFADDRDRIWPYPIRVSKVTNQVHCLDFIWFIRRELQSARWGDSGAVGAGNNKIRDLDRGGIDKPIKCDGNVVQTFFTRRTSIGIV